MVGARKMDMDIMGSRNAHWIIAILFGKCYLVGNRDWRAAGAMESFLRNPRERI